MLTRNGVYWPATTRICEVSVGVDVTETSFMAAFDAVVQERAQAALLVCCASIRWAAEVAARRPYPDLATMTEVSDAALAALDWADVRQALEGHPRIGERAEGAGREASWSRTEQSAAATDDDTAARLVAGNVEYERRFGHVFLIRASGRSAEEILAALHSRLDNDEATERLVVRVELRDIVRLRLAKLAGPAAS